MPTEPVQPAPEPSEPAFTWKALAFGLLGVALIAGIAVFNDNHLRQSLFVGNHFPTGAFFYVLLLALGWNLLVARAWPALALRTREMTVVLAMSLAACFPPTSALFRYFQRQLILPFYYLRDKPKWQEFGLLDYLPGKLFPLDGRLDQTVYMGFIQGMARGTQSVGLGDIPWGAWMAPLAYWAPLVLLMTACTLGLSVLVHRQWVDHEQLSYPIATVATAFVRRSPGRRGADLFGSRLFWASTLFVLVLYAFKYLSRWFPSYVPDISFQWNIWGPLTAKLPLIRQVPTFNIGSQNLFFTVVGITFFLSSEIGVSMGLTSLLLFFAGLQAYVITGEPFTGDDVEHLRAGAYVGYALVLLYTGRHYYGRVLARALGFGRTGEYERDSVLGARLALVSFAGFVWVLTRMGLDGLAAFAFALTLMLLFLVFTRVICETGIPFLQAGWWPGTFLAALVGPAALGPAPLVFTYWLNTILVQDPRECLMPYVATGLKVADDARVSRTRLLRAVFLAVLVSLAVSFVVSTWYSYTYGAISVDRWASVSVPQLYFDRAQRAIARLKETGQLEAARQATGLAKLRLAAFDGRVAGFAGAGLAAVAALSLLRFRFPKCPFHPVIFVVWGSYPSSVTWWSFLVGWALKELVVRFGGGKAYQQLKPLFIGLIAGELLAAGASTLTGLVYYFATKQVPPAVLNVLPM